MSNHYLDVQLNTENVSTRFHLPLGTTVVGSEETCHLVLSEGIIAVAPTHCEFRCTEDSCQVQDLGTEVGTWVGDEQLAPEAWYRLQPGDVVSIGMYYLTYWLQETVNEGDDEQPEEEKRPLSPPPAPPSPPPANSVDPDEDGGGTGNGRFAPPSPVGPFPSFHHSHGNDIHSRYLQYLPGIYHDNPFTVRFLALLESILAPIEWNINSFDLYLDPNTAPSFFLPRLATWFGVQFDYTWTEERQREFLRHATTLQTQRGTAVGLKHLLEIYTGQKATIDDTQTDNGTFRVTLPLPPNTRLRQQIIHLINSYKPAFTDYELLLTGSESATETP